MSFSDFVLAILVLAVAALVLWVYDINPYTNKLQIYSQQCDNMILNNTYCKGTWHDKPIETFIVDQQTQNISLFIENQPNTLTLENCSIQDRKNWSCDDTLSNKVLSIVDGKLQFDVESNIQQITRLQWLQNKILNLIN